MGGFRDPLTVTFLSPREVGADRLVRLAHNLNYDDVCAPEGFISDGPSIPQVFWNLLPTWDIRWGPAGVIHDFLCCLLAMGRPHESYPTRKDCDRLFAGAAWSSGCGVRHFVILYLGVCFGRWFNVRTTMIDYNVKLSAILEQRVDKSSLAAVAQAQASPVGGSAPLPLIGDHPHTLEALGANPAMIIQNAAEVAKVQATERSK